MIGKKLQKEMAKQGHEGNPFGEQSQPAYQKEDTGNIHVHKNPQESKEFDGGEYVDYEEIKE
jgi:hypothetical protein